MAGLPDAASASTPLHISQILDNHISLLKSHLDFLNTLKSNPSATVADDDHVLSSDHSTILSSMISRAAIALHDARICSKKYQNHATPQGVNGTEEQETNTSPSLPLRHKRPSEVNVDVNGNEDGEGVRDMAAQPTKRLRRSSGRQFMPNHDCTTSTHAPDLGPLPPATTIEYTDITPEVNARLAAREERRRQRILQHTNGTVKRKRRSSMGDSLLMAGSDDEDVEPGGLSRRERKMERARRISAGGTRKIKRVKVRRETDWYVGEAGTIVPLPGEGVAGLGIAAANEVNGDAKNAGTAEMAKEGVKVALNDVEVDGAPQKSGGNTAESKAKKRRRSSFVRSQGQDTGMGENKHPLDDRSTKRRRR